MNLSSRDKLIITVAAITIFTGATAAFVKIGTREMSAELFTLIRFGIAGIVLIPLFLKSKFKFNRKFFELMAVSSLASLNVLLFAKGIILTSANVGSTVYVLTPLVVAIMSFFILKENVNVKKSAGIAFGLVGALIIILLPLLQKNSPFSGNLEGNILIGIAVFSFSLYTVLSKKLHLHFSPLQINMVFIITTFLIMILLNIPQMTTIASTIQGLSFESIVSVVFVGIISTALHYVLYQYIVKHGSPLIASTILYLQPISTVIWSYFLLGERLTIGLVIGGILAVAGTYLVVSGTKTRKAGIDTESAV